MATRTFTVFQDTPSSSHPRPSTKPVRAASGILTRSASTSKSNLVPVPDPTGAMDKENYNPVTGRKPSASGLNGEKKRKTTVLALKAHVPTASTAGKKPKPPPRVVAEPEAKKRRVVPAKPAPKPKVLAPQKDIKSTSSLRKPKRTSPVRKVASLPKVVEESVPETAKEPNQATIDSRCYDLTVSPLADVSEAYQASVFSGPTILEEGPFRTVKEASAEPELRDYFTLESFASLASSRRVLLSEEPESKPPSTTLSTPERAKLYASFTFSSPSPSSKRFRDLYASQPGSPTRRTTTKKASTTTKPSGISPVAFSEGTKNNTSTRALRRARGASTVLHS